MMKGGIAGLMKQAQQMQANSLGMTQQAAEATRTQNSQIDAFSGDPAKAEALVRSNRSDYLVMCRASGETSVYAKRRADNLSSAIDQGHAPGWLVPVPGFADGALLVYRLR